MIHDCFDREHELGHSLNLVDHHQSVVAKEFDGIGAGRLEHARQVETSFDPRLQGQPHGTDGGVFDFLVTT